MKSEILIKGNLEGKLAVYLTGVSDKDKPRIIEHIRMLDWVLNESYIRSIETIIRERG